jgi:hypothetical protein
MNSPRFSALDPRRGLDDKGEACLANPAIDRMDNVMSVRRVSFTFVIWGAAFCGALLFGGAEGKAQDMQTFLNNLNRQMSSANQHYRAGIAIYNSVPYYKKLDYKCAHGDARACSLHQQQLNNANNYMARHYQSLGR